MLETIGDRQRLTRRFGLLLVGIPLAQRREGDKQLAEIRSFTQEAIPMVLYRMFVGEHASASAVATVLAAEFVRSGSIPSGLTDGQSVNMEAKGALVLGLGKTITALEILPGHPGTANGVETAGPLRP